VNDALLLVDVLNDFSHEDGDRLRASFRRTAPALIRLLADCRQRGVPIVYANDHFGDWTADRRSMVERAARSGAYADAGEVMPQPDEPVVVKPRYSAFDHTPLPLLLEELAPERILLVGMALEMCVAQTAIAAREHGYKVTVIADACPVIDDVDADAALTYLRRVVGVRTDGASHRATA
jgi:nicotinamidase-related amidase